MTIELLCRRDGNSDVSEFIDALSNSDRRKIDVLFELMGAKGRITNSEKFKKLEGSDGIWEFKSFQVRLLCFFIPGKRLVVCKGLIKKRDKHDSADVRFAEDCKRNFLE